MTRVALVHDWLTGMRGGERVLEALIGFLPGAEIFTLVHHRGSVSEAIEARPIRVSFLDAIPIARHRYRWTLPLMPAAVERFDLSGFDLVVSSSHCVAKGVRPPPGVPHLCYCHTPMRYVWDQYDAYFGPGRASLPVRAAMGMVAPRLRRWDRATAARVTAFVANSHHVRERIRRLYDRDAAVVHPPVALERFSPGDRREDFYLCLGALVPYKRVDLVVNAATRLGRALVVAGDGPEASALRRRAGPTVRFVGRVTDEEVARLLGRCRALVHAGVEDFGITLVEAQAAGAPVVARGAGGALETVIPPGGDAPPTGVLFDAPTVDGVADALLRFEATTFDPLRLRAHAEGFGADRFREGMRRALDALGRPGEAARA